MPKQVRNYWYAIYVLGRLHSVHPSLASATAEKRYLTTFRGQNYSTPFLPRIGIDLNSHNVRVLGLGQKPRRIENELRRMTSNQRSG